MMYDCVRKKDSMARKIRFFVFLTLALAIVCFIFSNSFQSGEESNEASGWVAAFLRPILNPFGRLDDDTFHALVRKLAHFVEFGALGTCLGGAACNVLWRGRWLCFGGICLLTACADETIQYFTGRFNSLKDVCIDFAGALCGLLFAFILAKIIVRYKEKRTWQS